MADNNWKKVQETLRKPATPASMQEAAAAFAQYRRTGLGNANSRPILVNLRRGGPNAVPVDRIPDKLATDPNFYNYMNKIVNKGKS